jgi:hypothetical protein
MRLFHSCLYLFIGLGELSSVRPQYHSFLDFFRLNAVVLFPQPTEFSFSNGLGV